MGRPLAGAQSTWKQGIRFLQIVKEGSLQRLEMILICVSTTHSTLLVLLFQCSMFREVVLIHRG